MRNEYGERLQIAMAEAKVSTTELAEKLKVSYQAVRKVLKGQSVAFSTDNHFKAAEILNVSSAWLASNTGPMKEEPRKRPLHYFANEEDEKNAQSKLETSNFERIGSVSPLRLPVVGMARLGENGYYEEIDSIPGQGDGTVEAYSEDPGAYALRVRGDSMFPAIRDGWYVVVEPHRSATPGEYVLVKLSNGQMMVKELIMKTNENITVVSVNGDQRRTIRFEDIDQHYGVQPVSAILSPSKWHPQ